MTAEGIEELGRSGHLSLFKAVPAIDTPQELLEELFDLQARARRSEGSEIDAADLGWTGTRH